MRTIPLPTSRSTRRRFIVGGLLVLAAGQCAPAPGGGCAPAPPGPPGRRPYPGRRTTSAASLVDAAQRGWGPGWPADRHGDMRAVGIPGTARAILVHWALAPTVARCLRDTVAMGYRLDEVADEGGYARRPMLTPSGAPTNRPSNHSWGTAVDLNWTRNPMSRTHLVTDIPAPVAVLWEEWGFDWGGRWLANGGRLADAMHMEYALSIDHARADAALADGV